MPATASQHKQRRALRVLIADDDRDTVESLAFILRDEGHVVHAVYTGSEVLPAARMFRPDAVILDIVIPGMSGYAAAQVIRSTYLDNRRPLLIGISGMWKEKPDRRVAQQVGFDHHVLKPYESGELLRLLEEVQPPGAADRGTPNSVPSVHVAALIEAKYLLGAEELCRRLGVDRAQLDRWLNGEAAIPRDVFFRAVRLLLDAPDSTPPS